MASKNKKLKRPITNTVAMGIMGLSALVALASKADSQPPRPIFSDNYNTGSRNQGYRSNGDRVERPRSPTPAPSPAHTTNTSDRRFTVDININLNTQRSPAGVAAGQVYNPPQYIAPPPIPQPRIRQGHLRSPHRDIGIFRGLKGGCGLLGLCSKKPRTRVVERIVEVPVPYAVEVPVEVPVPYAVEVPVPYAVQVPVEVPVLYAVEIHRPTTCAPATCRPATCAPAHIIHPHIGNIAPAPERFYYHHH